MFAEWGNSNAKWEKIILFFNNSKIDG